MLTESSDDLNVLFSTSPSLANFYGNFRDVDHRPPSSSTTFTEDHNSADVEFTQVADTSYVDQDGKNCSAEMFAKYYLFFILEKLIEAISGHGVIWDTSDVHYKNRDKRMSAWKEVLSEMSQYTIAILYL